MYGHAFRSRRALRALITGSLIAALCGFTPVRPACAQGVPDYYDIHWALVSGWFSNVSYDRNLTYNGHKPINLHVDGFTHNNLNNNGDFLVRVDYDPYIPVTYLVKGGQAIPLLTGLPNDTYDVQAQGLNDSDVVAGFITNYPYYGINSAVSWSSSDGLPSALDPSNALFSINGIPQSYESYALNSYGDIVGSGIVDDGNGGQQGMGFIYAPRLFHAPHIFQSIPAFSVPGFWPNAVNNNNIAVGSSYPNGGPQHASVVEYGSKLQETLINGYVAFNWTYFANPYDLTPTLPDGTFGAVATAVNNHNQVLIQEDSYPNTFTYLYNYDPSSHTATQKAQLTAPYPASYKKLIHATAINDAGVSAGDESVDGISAAMVYDTNGTGYDLNTMISPLSSLFGVHLDTAVGINNAGQILVQGHYSSQNYVLLLNPYYNTQIQVDNGDFANDFSGSLGETILLEGHLLRTKDNSALGSQTLTLKIDGNPVGTTTTLQAQGIGEFYYKLSDTLSLGTHAVTLTFAGDSQDGPSTGTGTLTVQAANTSVAVANVSGAIGQKITLSAKLARTTDNAPLSGRKLAFYVNNVSVGAPTTNNTGKASLSYTPPASLGAGSKTIRVSFAWDGKYAPSSGSGNLTVSKANTHVALSNVSGYQGHSVTLIAKLIRTTDNQPLPSQKLTFAVNGVTVGTATTNSSGLASYSYTIPANMSKGSHSIKASYTGDSADNASTGTGTLTVN